MLLKKRVTKVWIQWKLQTPLALACFVTDQDLRAAVEGKISSIGSCLQTSALLKKIDRSFYCSIADAIFHFPNFQSKSLISLCVSFSTDIRTSLKRISKYERLLWGIALVSSLSCLSTVHSANSSKPRYTELRPLCSSSADRSTASG